MHTYAYTHTLACIKTKAIAIGLQLKLWLVLYLKLPERNPIDNLLPSKKKIKKKTKAKEKTKEKVNQKFFQPTWHKVDFKKFNTQFTQFLRNIANLFRLLDTKTPVEPIFLRFADTSPTRRPNRRLVWRKCLKSPKNAFFGFC